jgi:metal-responsive CopG/Arc/MetJ family transcriptional regulator
MAGMRFSIQLPVSWLALLQKIADAEGCDKRTALIQIIADGLHAKERELTEQAA